MGPTLEILFGTGVSGDVARSVSWAETELGPVERWPASLRTTVATIFHSRHPMFLWWGPNLVQFYNDAYLPSFGIGKHPFAMGQCGRDCWPEVWPIIGPQIDDVMKRGVPSWNEDQLVPIHRNGRIEEVYWTYGYSPVFDDEGRIGGTLVVCTETTSRVIAERRLGLLRSLGDALLSTREPSGTLRLAANELASDEADVPFAILAAPGVPALTVGIDDEAAARVEASVPKDVRSPRTVTLTAAVPSTPWPEPVTTVYVLPIEGSGHVLFGVSPRLPLDDEYERFLGQIAQQIASTRARVRLESERRNLLEQAPVPAALLMGPNHVFEIANPLYCKMVGRDVRGKAYLDAFPELRGKPLSGIIADVYRTGEPFVTNEMPVALARGSDGSVEEGFFKFSLAPIRSDDGSVSGMMAIAIEITEQIVARRELQTAARAKDDFLATMSHELRTPLNAMLGWARMLKHDAGDAAKVAKGIAVIERNAEAQTRLVNDLLEVSRIISGKLSLTLVPVDVARTIAAALDVVRPSADAKRVRLEAAIAPDVDTIVADPDRVQQILWNLLSNAVRFTPADGSVRVSATRAASWLYIEVADTGEGIRAEHLGQIFERFRQVDARTTRQHGGLGLGLAIVRYLVEGHGGTVSARSAGAGMGTTFDVRLPIRPVEPTTPTRASRPTPNGPPKRWTAAGLDGLRILLVDDERDSLDLFADILTSAGAAVTAARSASEALAEPGPFDIIVSDVGMPEMDGYELVERVRRREKNGVVPAIAVSAYARAEDVARARTAGFLEHLAKPVDPSDLVALIVKLTRRSPPADR